MESNDNKEKEPRKEVFVTSWGQEVTMTYNPALDNLPEQDLGSKKYEEAKRKWPNLKPPIDLAEYLRTQGE